MTDLPFRKIQHTKESMLSLLHSSILGTRDLKNLQTERQQYRKKDWRQTRSMSIAESPDAHCSMCCGFCDQKRPNLRSKINHDSQDCFFGRNSFQLTHHPLTQRYVFLPETKCSQLQPPHNPGASLSFEAAKRAYQFVAHGIQYSLNADAGIGPTHNRLYFAPIIRIVPARHQPNR